MYLVKIENGEEKKTIHNDIISMLNPRRIENGTIIKEINYIDSFSFNIYPNNPGYNDLFEYSTIVSVYNTKRNDREEFTGRIIKVKDVMSETGIMYKYVHCEGLLGYLKDVLTSFLSERYWNVVNDSFEEDGTLDKKGFLNYIIDLYNSKVTEDKKFYLGRVDVTAEDEELYFGTQQTMNVFDAIKEKIIDRVGGEIRAFKDKDGKKYIDLLKELGETKTTELRLKKNIKSLNRETDPSSFVTRLYPLGQKIKMEQTDSYGNKSEVETDERITIAEANEGKAYIDDTVGIALYGILEGYYIWDHVANPSTLLQHGKTHMAVNNKVKQKHEISALDLSTIGLDYDDFDIYNYYPVINESINVNEKLRIIKKTIYISSPETSILEIGDKYATLTELQIKKINDTKNETLDIIKTIENNALLGEEKTSKYFTSLINQFADSITQLIKETTVQTKDFNTYKNEVSTQLTQTSTDFTYLFSQVKEQITELNGVVNTNQNELLKYIRFEDGSIILGIVGNDLILKESNDRISFLQNNVEVAYFSNSKLYITDGEFFNSLMLPYGFGFYKDTNNSLSFGKIGG